VVGFGKRNQEEEALAHKERVKIGKWLDMGIEGVQMADRRGGCVDDGAIEKIVLSRELTAGVVLFNCSGLSSLPEYCCVIGIVHTPLRYEKLSSGVDVGLVG
jgi:hypothetical protein